MNVLVPRRQLVPGNPGRWAFDLGIIGAASGALAPGMVLFDPLFSVVAGATGLMGGVVLGAVLPVVLDRLRGRASLVLIGALMPLLGAVWGGMAGWAGGMAIVGQFHGAPGLGLFFGGIAGALQLGIFWFPYTVLSTVRQHTWPIVLCALLIAPGLGWTSLVGLGGAMISWPVWVLLLPVFMAWGVWRSLRR